LLPAGTFISTKDAENSVENPSTARGLPMKWESGKPLTFGVNHLKNLREHVGTASSKRVLFLVTILDRIQQMMADYLL
jgi:hypothetical protein